MLPKMHNIIVRYRSRPAYSSFTAAYKNIVLVKPNIID